MRVLIVHDRCGDHGGAEVSVRHSARGLRQRGAELALLHGGGTGQGEARFVEDFSEVNDWSAAPSGAAVDRALGFRPDVIYVHKLAHLGVLEGLTQCGVPLVRMVHDHDMYCQRGARYFPWNRQICTQKAGYACAVTCSVVRDRDGPLPIKLLRPGLKLRELELCRRFNHHVVATSFMKRELVLHDFPAAQISILPPVPAAAAPDYVARYTEPLVLFVGQLLRGKGVDVMIRALAMCQAPGWRALIIGEGSHRASCEAVVDELGLRDRVRFTGWIDQGCLKQHYQNARVGVVPSLWPEPMGIVGLEFMQHGIPVVGFDAGGVSDWLRHGENGYLVPLIETRQLAGRIDALLQDPELAGRMGADGLAKARRLHDQAAYFDQLHELLAQQARVGMRR